MGVVKAGPDKQMCGVITLHRWLPIRKLQIMAARDWGIPELQFKEDDVSALWIDDVRKVKTTNWPSKLPQRADLFDQQKQVKGRGDSVFFVNPLAVGFSAKHAREVIEQVFDNGHLVYVHSTGETYRKGNDLVEFFGAHRRMIKAAQQGDFRNSQSAKGAQQRDFRSKQTR